MRMAQRRARPYLPQRLQGFICRCGRRTTALLVGSFPPQPPLYPTLLADRPGANPPEVRAPPHAYMATQRLPQLACRHLAGAWRRHGRRIVRAAVVAVGRGAGVAVGMMATAATAVPILGGDGDPPCPVGLLSPLVLAAEALQVLVLVLHAHAQGRTHQAEAALSTPSMDVPWGCVIWTVDLQKRGLFFFDEKRDYKDHHLIALFFSFW